MIGKKSAIYITVLAGILILFGWWFLRKQDGEPRAELPEAFVIMKDGKFEPETLIIKINTRVVFKNEDISSRWPASNLHPTHGIYPEFDPQQPIALGKEWGFVFDKTGSWQYHDHLSPTVRGTVNVTQLDKNQK